MSAEVTWKVMENLLKHGKYNIVTRNAMENAVRLLKENPEVVRCKDCNNRGTSDCPIEELCHGWIPSDDWFCADGERRSDNG